MADPSLTVRTRDDGTIVLQPHGEVGLDAAVELRQTLVHLVRRVRPCRLVVDLAEVTSLDDINAGTLVAIVPVADEHGVAVFLDNSPAGVADLLCACGVPQQRLRPLPA
ncbi:STAS domain-containing protein [Micromonospora costi]|uniref:STAS domain-containing protein n=1 Tax=Micromonospora costi TaxID=1530042 RepID=UPI001F4F0228|nr:STAS domain-containing protein [Micromonospora costi]